MNVEIGIIFVLNFRYCVFAVCRKREGIGERESKGAEDGESDME
jgi:hypothetical protein